VNLRWFSVLVLLGAAAVGFGARLDDMAIRDSMMAKGSLMGHRWLEKNGEAIYGTRGGPYLPTRDYGATRTAQAVYLHVFADAHLGPLGRFAAIGVIAGAGRGTGRKR
jgi:hypothetical protein